MSSGRTEGQAGGVERGGAAPGHQQRRGGGQLGIHMHDVLVRRGLQLRPLPPACTAFLT